MFHVTKIFIFEQQTKLNHSRFSLDQEIMEKIIIWSFDWIKFTIDMEVHEITNLQSVQIFEYMSMRPQQLF